MTRASNMSKWVRRQLRADPAAWAVVAASLLCIVWANAAFLSPPALFHLADEGYIQAVAVRMLDGQMLPYVDGVGHRGPLLYFLAAIATGVFGSSSWLPVRVLAFAAMLLTALFTFLAGRAAGRAFAGAVGCVAVALLGLVVMVPADGMGYNGEYLLNVFAVGALWSITVGLGRATTEPRMGYVALGGIATALAVMAKQNGAVMIAVLGLWIVAAAASRTALSRKRRWWLVGAFAAGVAAPWLLLVARYALAGELATLRYYLLTYNVDVYMEALTDVQKRALVVRWLTNQSVLFAFATALVLWGLRRVIIGPLRSLLERFDTEGFAPTVAWGAMLGLASCNTTLRNFWHYYVQVVPWFGLLVGMLLDRAMAKRQTNSPRAVLQRLLVLLPIVIWIFVAWELKAGVYHHAQDTIRRKTGAICLAVSERSTAGQAIFVWGFRPDLYTWCGRKPASRFVYTTFVAGFVPWATHMTKEQEDRFTVPGSRELLVSDLERSKPPIIIDAAGSLGGRSIKRYERLAQYVERHYCPGGERDGLPLLLRRDGSGDCPPPL